MTSPLSLLRVALALLAALILVAPVATAGAPAPRTSASPSVPTPTVAVAAAQNDDQAASEEAGESAPEEEPNLVDEGLEQAKALGKRLMEDPVGVLKEWFLEEGPRLLSKILVFLLILLVSRIVANALGRVTRAALQKSKLNASELFKNFVVNTLTKIVFFVGLIVALQSIGINVAPLLAGIGVLGFVIGFALQDTLGNFASGVMLLLYRPYDIGDVVSVTGETGSVEAMTLVSTTLLTPDNQRLTIPNGAIWGSVIRNVTANTTRRIDEPFGIGYEDDIEKAEAVMLDVVKSMEHVQAEPAPQVLLMELADSSVNFTVRAWVPTGDYFGTVCELRRRMKMRFDQEGISIPYPQQDVHMHQADAATS
ncbi:MAG: mechanosensitive ion channel family protein [Planctomycetota bacterium]